MSRDAIRPHDLQARHAAVADLPLWSLGVAEAGRRIAGGSLTPTQLLESVLDRIAQVDGAVRSYIRVMADEARAAAAEATAEVAAGRWRGPLHGIPFAVKDNYDVAGVPATAASHARLTVVPARDAALVLAAKRAGAILVGKLATWEYGTGNGGEYFDLPFPPARNPWDLERFTGGSSTGAGASVAAGTALFALGSDTTGSVRLPAGGTGMTGIIPTPGLLSLEGILPNCYSLDVPGPICRTAEDTALVLDALVPGKGFARGVGQGIAGLRIAVVREQGAGFPAPDGPMTAAFEAALGELAAQGATLEEVRLPVPAAECLAITQMIGPSESATIHEAELRERPGDLGRALRDKLLAGACVRAVDYIQALRRRTEVAYAIDALMSRFDALVTYGTLHIAPRIGVEPEMTAYTLETMLAPFNLSASPALVQCTGFTAEGLPTHWQVVGNRGDEATVLRIAGAYERATRWGDRWPDIPAEAPLQPPVASPERTVPSDAFRVRAARMGLGGLGDIDLARMEELEERAVTRGGALPRPVAKEVQPAFGLQRPHD